MILTTKQDLQNALAELIKLKAIADYERVHEMLERDITYLTYKLERWDSQVAALNDFIEYVKNHKVERYTSYEYGDGYYHTWYVDDSDNDDMEALYNACYLHEHFSMLIDDNETNTYDGYRLMFTLKTDTTQEGIKDDTNHVEQQVRLRK